MTATPWSGRLTGRVAAAGPLVVAAANPRYFATASRVGGDAGDAAKISLIVRADQPPTASWRRCNVPTVRWRCTRVWAKSDRGGR